MTVRYRRGVVGMRRISALNTGIRGRSWMLVVVLIAAALWGGSPAFGVEVLSYMGDFRGTTLGAPVGVATAGDGTVYVADLLKCSVHRFSSRGEFLGSWGTTGTGEGQFYGAAGVAVAPDQSVYVTDWQNCRVEHFTATGDFLGRWGTQGAAPGQMEYPVGVAVASNGIVYVADAGNCRVQRFSAEGDLLGEWGSRGTGDGQFLSPDTLAIGVDGSVWVGDSGRRCIQRFGADGEFVANWGTSGSGVGRFQTVSGLAIGADGSVFVADCLSHRVQRFSAAGEYIEGCGSEGSGAGQFKNPYGVAVGANGCVYATDFESGRVQYFHRPGQGWVPPGSVGHVPYYRGQFGASTMYGNRGVAIAPDGSVYVAAGGHVEHYTPDGELLGSWGSDTPSSGFNPPGVAVAPDGTVFVTDSYFGVQHFTATGELIGAWGTHGTGEGQFMASVGVAVAPDGSVYVSDMSNSTIQHFTATGEFLGCWGSHGSGPGQFNFVGFLTVAVDGSVFVADTANYRIQHFDANGIFRGQFGVHGSGYGQILGARGVRIAPDNTLYVADGARVQRFTQNGEFLGSWGTSGTGDGQFAYCVDTAVSPDGRTVYVSDMRNNRVQYFRYSDTTPPVTTASGGPFETWTNAAMFSLEATDGADGSGVASTQYSLDGSAAVTCPAGDVAVSEEGTTTISYWSVDNAGNIEATKTAMVLVDKTAPVTTIATPANGTTYYQHQAATANWAVTDALSGVATTTASVANGAALDTSSPGTHTVTVSATDAAGNTAEKTVSYMVVTPTRLFRDLLASYDAGIADKTLSGTGSYPRSSAAAERALIVLASGCYDAYLRTHNRAWLDAGVSTMRLVGQLCDGEPGPSDLVTGTARGELNTRVETLRGALGSS
jgi:sugar lactone lactonase YvrE